MSRRDSSEQERIALEASLERYRSAAGQAMRMSLIEISE